MRRSTSGPQRPRPWTQIRPSGRNLLDAGESCAFGPGSYEVEAVAGGLRGRAEFTVPDHAEGILEVIVEMR